MARYVARRLLQMCPVLFGATFLIFVVIKLAPGDPFSGMIDPKLSPQKLAEARERLCLDCPLPQQYGLWLREAARGNLGYSIRYKVPVTALIGERLGPTVALGLTAQLFIFLVGIPLGVLAAARRNSPLDQGLSLVTMAGLCVPGFLMGLLLLNAFALGDWHVLPTGGLQTPGAGLRGLPLALDRGRHMLLPALAMGLTGVAVLMRFVRSAMLEVYRRDFVRTARAKGLQERVVLFKHALRNAMIPVVTLTGLSLPELVGGAIITESIFLWPGIGRLTYTAILERDYPVLMGLNLMFALMTMLGSLLADIGYAVVDPRIRYQ